MHFLREVRIQNPSMDPYLSRYQVLEAMEENTEDGFDTLLEDIHLEGIDLQKIMEDCQRRYIHSILSKQKINCIEF